MVLTLELPVRPVTDDPLFVYERRFGALPFWLEQLNRREARALARLALRQGRPLAAADESY